MLTTNISNEIMTKSIHEFYGNRLRIRACAICIQNDALLLVNHRMNEGDFWSPPGGGIEFGESALDCLIRELKEETGLEGSQGEFIFAAEFIQPPLHAVELFFHVPILEGTLAPGRDPETGDHQIITDVRWMRWAEIKSLEPSRVHRIFQNLQNLSEITRLKGYFKL